MSLLTLEDNIGNSITFSKTSEGGLQVEGFTIGGITSNTPFLISSLTHLENGLNIDPLDGYGKMGGALTKDTVIDAVAYALTLNGNIKLTGFTTTNTPQDLVLALDSQGKIIAAPAKAKQGSIEAGPGGDVTGNLPGPLTISTGAVTGSKIATGAVGDSQISTISWSKISAATVPAFVLSTAIIAASSDLTGTYAVPTIKAGAVTADKIPDHVLTATKMDASAMITSVEINGGGKQYGDVKLNVPVIPPTTALTASVTLTAADSGKKYSYSGTTDITVTLPANAVDMNFTFYVNGTGKLTIQASKPNDPISIGGIKTDGGCWIQNNTSEAEVFLYCYIQHKWSCGRLFGDWKFSGVEG